MRRQNRVPYILADLEALLKEGSGDNLEEWGCRVCKAARQAHLNVWLLRASDEDVKRMKTILTEMLERMRGAPECEVYRRNSEIRLRNLDKYLEGGLPELLEPELLEEVARR